MGKERVQLITADGEPQYAVLNYADYLELLRRAEGRDAPLAVAPLNVAPPQQVVEFSHKADTPFQPDELVRLRKQQGLSQSQLAKSTKLGLMNLIQIETGQRRPNHAVRATLARALGVDEL